MNVRIPGRKFEAHELQQIVDAVSARKYDHNLTTDRCEEVGNGVAFTLRVNDSSGPGHRLSQHRARTKNGEGKRFRMVHACWHAHRDVMRALFDKYPTMILRSGMATYKGKGDFEYQFETTGDRNIGSIMDPITYRQACDCAIMFAYRSV